MHTIEEAKTKLCPMKFRAEMDMTDMCDADECMWWVWEKKTVTVQDHTTFEPKRGRCGRVKP